MNVPAIPEPSTLDVATVGVLGRELLAWAEQTDDVTAVRDATARWAAITEYVRRTSREGVAEAEAALRRLEVRIGKLLGDPRPGERTDLSGVTDGFSSDARHDLRRLAEHADVVEQVIAASDDASPPSRRKCLTEIARRRDAAGLAEDLAEAEAAAPRIRAALATLDAIPEHRQSPDKIVFIPEVIRGRIDDARWEVGFTVESTEGMLDPTVTELRVRMREGGEAISPGMLRGVRLAEAVQRAVELAGVPFDKVGDDYVATRFAATPREARSALRRNTKRAEMNAQAAEAAEHYRRLKQGGDVSTAVGEAMHMHRATAHRRIQLARELGYLGGDE